MILTYLTFLILGLLCGAVVWLINTTRLEYRQLRERQNELANLIKEIIRKLK